MAFTIDHQYIDSHIVEALRFMTSTELVGSIEYELHKTTILKFVKKQPGVINTHDIQDNFYFLERAYVARILAKMRKKGILKRYKNFEDLTMNYYKDVKV